jgi:hypothetical protein
MLRFMVTLDWFLIPEGSGEGHATGIPRRIEPDDEETDPEPCDFVLNQMF